MGFGVRSRRSSRRSSRFSSSGGGGNNADAALHRETVAQAFPTPAKRNGCDCGRRRERQRRHCGMGEKGARRQRSRSSGGVPRSGTRSVCALRAPWPDLGQSRDHSGACSRSRRQRLQQRSRRARDRAAVRESGGGRALHDPAAAGPSGRHEHQRCVGIGQEHAAASTTQARGRTRCALERIRDHRPDIWRNGFSTTTLGPAYKWRPFTGEAADHRPEARLLHGPQD